MKTLITDALGLVRSLHGTIIQPEEPDNEEILGLDLPYTHLGHNVPFMSQRVEVFRESQQIKALRTGAGWSQHQLADRIGRDRKTISRWETGKVKPHVSVVELIRMLCNGSTSVSGRPGDRFRFIDLFAGIGGTRIGFESVGGRCVFTCEWDKYCVQTYRANHRVDHAIAGDITKVSVEEIPSHDVLLAGFPCQPFSIAGVSKKKSLGRAHGFADETQGTLFFDIARVLDAKRPQAFLLENVKNLKSHDKGRTFEVIRRTLTEELGYHLHHGVIDAKAFVPQHRERVFLVGFRENVDFRWDDIFVPSMEQAPRLESILHSADGKEVPEERFTNPHGRALDKYVLSDKLWNYLQAYAEKHRLKGNGFGFGLVGPSDVARTLSARYYKDGSEILIRRSQGNPRRLTPRECARLMGFDSPGSKPFKIPVSDTQAYKQFGNSLVVPVVKAVASAMAPHLRAEAKMDSGQLSLPFVA